MPSILSLISHIFYQLRSSFKLRGRKFFRCKSSSPSFRVQESLKNLTIIHGLGPKLRASKLLYISKTPPLHRIVPPISSIISNKPRLLLAGLRNPPTKQPTPPNKNKINTYCRQLQNNHSFPYKPTHNPKQSYLINKQVKNLKKCDRSIQQLHRYGNI